MYALLNKICNVILQSLIIGEMATGLAENMSSATTALMSQVPPPHFCDMVVRLIALQILAFGVSTLQLFYCVL